MKKILIKDEYGINDVGNEEKVNEIIDDIDIKSENVVQLNLRHCLIDYPTTAKLIDKILFQLKNLSGKKELFIVLDYDLPKQTLFNWLFLGSKFFDIEKEKELPIEELGSRLKTKAMECDISLEVSILNRSGETKSEYKY